MRWGPIDALTLGGKRRQARWAAVVLGVLAGAWYGSQNLFALTKNVGAGYWGYWVAGLGHAAPAITLLPLSILAIFKPRAAAYVALVALAVALVFPLVGSHWTPTEFDVMPDNLLLDVIRDLPLAAVAALLFYASAGKHAQA